MRRLRLAAGIGVAGACIAAASCTAGGVLAAGGDPQATVTQSKSAAKIPVVRHPGGRRVSPGMFGMHILHSPDTWPTVPVNAVRIWDDYATWRDLEPRPGVWHWARLDQRITAARSHHAMVLLVLGQTPKWASSLPHDDDAYGRGAAAPPAHMSDWRAYVRAVADRYRGQIGAYEVWNEPNWTYMYHGSPQRLAALTRTAHDVVESQDPSAKILSPSFVITDRYNPTWLNAYFRAGGAKYTDVTNVHVYTHGGSPETARSNMATVNRIMRRWHVRQPIWDTEHNLDHPNRSYSPKAGGAILARGYLLDRWLGIQRTFWYAWNNHGWGGIFLTGHGGRPTRSAAAYQTVYKWLAGARERSCSHNGVVWSCTLQRKHSVSVAVWSISGHVNASVPRGFHHLKPLYGQPQHIRPGHAVLLTHEPVLLTQ
jgi:hypothetical protein